MLHFQVLRSPFGTYDSVLSSPYTIVKVELNTCLDPPTCTEHFFKDEFIINHKHQGRDTGSDPGFLNMGGGGGGVEEKIMYSQHSMSTKGEVQPRSRACLRAPGALRVLFRWISHVVRV